MTDNFISNCISKYDNNDELIDRNVAIVDGIGKSDYD